MLDQSRKRRKRPPDDQQRHQLASVRMTLAEYALVKRRAQQAGMSVSAYVRVMTLGSDVKIVEAQP